MSCRAADAGLIPYARNTLTESIFPMKVYEYLAAGLPVVATPLPALADVAEVATAPDAQGIAELLDEALAGDSPERRAERSRAAASIRGSDAWRRSRRRSMPYERSARHHAYSCAALRSGDAYLRSGTCAGSKRTAWHLLYVRFGAPEPDAAFKAIPGIKLHEVEPSRGRAAAALSYGRPALQGCPTGFARGKSRGADPAMPRRSRASRQTAGRVIADGPIAAAALASLAHRRPVIYNAHNLESGFRQR